MSGTKEIDDILSFFEAFAEFLKDARSDGKFDNADSFKALMLTPELIAAGVGAQNIPAEFKEMTAEERQEFVSRIKGVMAKFVDAFK